MLRIEILKLHERRMRRALLALQEHRLPEPRRTKLLRHLQNCGSCRATLDGWMRSETDLQRARPEPKRLPPESAQAIFEQALRLSGANVRPASGRRVPLRRGMAATACLLAAGASYLYVRPLLSHITAEGSKSALSVHPPLHSTLRGPDHGRLASTTATDASRKQKGIFANRPGKRYRPEPAFPAPSLKGKAEGGWERTGAARLSWTGRKAAGERMVASRPSSFLLRPSGTLRKGSRRAVETSTVAVRSHESGPAAQGKLLPQGRLIVIVTHRPDPLVVTVSHAPAETPGEAQVAAYRLDAHGGTVWTQCTVTAGDRGVEATRIAMAYIRPGQARRFLAVQTPHGDPGDTTQQQP